MAVPGFCGAPAAPPVLPTHDPNADLIGMQFPVDTGGFGTVMGTWRLIPTYVEVDTDKGPTLRDAARLRRWRKELV